LAELHVKSFSTAYKDIIPNKILKKFTIKKRLDIFKNNIKKGIENIYLIEEKGIVYGFISIGKCRDYDKSNLGEMWRLFVSSQNWRKGYGKKLLEYGENLLKRQGYKKIFLWVLKDSLPARQFYENYGYKFDGNNKKVKDFGGIEAIRYCKEINPCEGKSRKVLRRKSYTAQK